jgi:hypothetical protein
VSQADRITLWHDRWGKIIPFHYMPPLLGGKGTARTERARERVRGGDRLLRTIPRNAEPFTPFPLQKQDVKHSTCVQGTSFVTTESYDNTEHNIVQERSVTSCNQHHRASLQSSPQTLTNGTTTKTSTNAKRSPREALVQVALPDRGESTLATNGSHAKGTRFMWAHHRDV